MVTGVEVVYTKDTDADMFIMAEAKIQRAAGAPRVVVVTGDTEISASLEYGSAMGWMTSEMYMLEMRRVRALTPHLQESDDTKMVIISMLFCLRGSMCVYHVQNLLGRSEI